MSEYLKIFFLPGFTPMKRDDDLVGSSQERARHRHGVRVRRERKRGTVRAGVAGV